MLRSFVGVFAPGGSRDAARLRHALEDEGEVHVLEAGDLTVAYTGDLLPRRDPGAPLCLLDGNVYETLGLVAPDGAAGQPESFLADAWSNHSEGLVDRLRGDFACLFFDPAAGRGLLVRDHMGGRSALWHESSGRVTFATEYRPLIATLPTRPAPDPISISHWIGTSGLPGDHSFYSGIRRVESGCAVRLEEGGSAAYRHWSPRPGKLLEGEPHELAAALRQAVERGVQRRIPADSDGAVLLSGGLDSGTVTAIGAKGPPESRVASTYSATFPRHRSVDESELIKELTATLGLRSTAISVRGGSVLSGALTYLRRFDVPPVSPNLFFWLPLLRRAAEDGTTVLLDGEGGDELFGYSAYLLADRVRRGRLRSAVKLVHQTPGAGEGASRRALALYLRRYALKGAVPYRLHDAFRRMRPPTTYAPDYLRPEAAADFSKHDDNHAWKRLPGPRWFANLLYRVTRGMGPGLAYDHIRRRGLLAGVEPRHPLIDADVIELVLRLPPELAFDPYLSRPLLRESLVGILPDSVRLRPAKSNFDAVFHESLTGPDMPAAQALLGRRDAEVGAYVDLAKVGDLMDKPPDSASGRIWWALRLWRLVTTECWLLSQNDPAALDRLLANRLVEADFELIPPSPAPVAGC